MKRLFTFVAMVAFAAGMMWAGWVPSDTESIKLDKEDADGQVQMKTIRTDEGKIILSWLRPERVDDVFSYQLHLQVFDANGEAQFGDEGIIVCSKPTRTWTTDYGLALAANGDILLAYNDIRNDPDYGDETEVYLYRYSQEGEPMWDIDGVRFPSWMVNQTTFSAEDVSPKICVSGDNIYVAASRTEYFAGGYKGQWQMVRIDNDGNAVPDTRKMFDSKIVVMEPAPEGNVYCVYDNSSLGLDAQLLDQDLNNVWDDALTIESRQVSNGRFMPTPLTAINENDNLMLSYRVLTDFYGFQVMNYLTPEGNYPDEPISLEGSIDGDAGSAALGVKENRGMVAWEYAYSSALNYMKVNVADDNNNYFWEGDKEHGINLDENDMWGFTPVKVIPTADGWVVLYGNLQSWNGANFMVVSIDEFGEVISTRQIQEDNFKSSGFSVVYDDQYAYIFYTQETQYDDNWEEIPGSSGMYVMCIQIAENQNPSAIDEVQTSTRINTVEIYTVDGRKVNELQPGVNIIRTTDENGVVTTKKMMN